MMGWWSDFRRNVMGRQDSKTRTPVDLAKKEVAAQSAAANAAAAEQKAVLDKANAAIESKRIEEFSQRKRGRRGRKALSAVGNTGRGFGSRNNGSGTGLKKTLG
tara:strand:- start:796 stop:1107 length:312 start_codon:yes stop_codon:yes gene_type:complete